MTKLEIPFTEEHPFTGWTREVGENNKRLGRHEYEPKECNYMSYPDNKCEDYLDYSTYLIPVTGRYLDSGRINCKTKEDVQKFLVHCAVKGATLAVQLHDWNTRYWYWADVCSMVAIGLEDTFLNNMGSYQNNTGFGVHEDTFVINTDMRGYKYTCAIDGDVCQLEKIHDNSYTFLHGVSAAMAQTFVDLAFAMSNFKHSKHGIMTPEIANSVRSINFHLNRTMVDFEKANMFDM